MPVTERAGANIHWRVDGDPARPALVLLNSLGSCLGLWEPVMPALLRDFHVLRVDKRGHGGSSATPPPYTIAGLADDVLAAMDAAGIDRAACAGVSIGGMIAMQLALQAPARIERIVVSNSSAYVGPGRFAERIAAVRSRGLGALADEVIERWFSPATIAAASPFVEQVYACFRAVDPEGYIGCCEAILAMDLRESLARIACPALVIAGRDDLSLPPEHSRLIAQRIPGARLVELPAAHIPHVDLPQEYAATLREFLLPTGAAPR